MNQLIIGLTFLIISGCSTLPETPKTGIANPCPKQPEGSLDNKDVKPISLNSQIVKVSGQASSTRHIGYTFEAKSGQELTYRTNDDICIWLYSPKNEILNTTTLPDTGKYIIQVSTNQGSKTFALEIGLDTLQASSPPTVSTTTNISPSTTTATTPEPVSQRPAADEFVKNHYSAINNRQYTYTWSRLSPEFQNISSSYLGYTKWWDSVREVKISEVRLINQTNDIAVVYAELWYVMKTNGNASKDSRTYIYLRWDEEQNSWVFTKKGSS